MASRTTEGKDQSGIREHRSGFIKNLRVAVKGCRVWTLVPSGVELGYRFNKFTAPELVDNAHKQSF
jgi:hypothetical protein